MKLFCSPEKKIKIEPETPSKYLNLNSHITSYHQWSEINLSPKKLTVFKDCDKIQKEIKPFQQQMFETNIKIEQENFTNKSHLLSLYDQQTAYCFEKNESFFFKKKIMNF